MEDNSRRKIAIIGVSSLLLVAMVVALTIGSLSKTPDDLNRSDVSASTKAIKTMCDSTDYKDTCIKSLSSSAGNSSDPKELIEAAFQVTIKHITDAANKSVVLRDLQQDPRTRLALENCRELADRAVEDLQKSYSMFQTFDFNNLKDMLNDLKIWISGAVTYQETCLDGFEDTPGDAGQKMREALQTAIQLTSNGLAMITDVASVITTLDISSYRNRRLLSENLPILGHGDGLVFPDWLDSRKRTLFDVSPDTTKPDLVVAKDGSGNYSTINEALQVIPKKSNRTFILHIKEGVYEEKVQFNNTLTHLMVIGDGPTKTRITGKLNFIDGTPTYHTATVIVLGEHFIAKDIGFENSAGPEKHQAVALRVGADKSIFYNCHMDGYQDTLYAHTYRQFYRDCRISGTIDFIFGDSAAIFQNCTLVVRKPLDYQQCIVTAQGRKDVRQPTGLVLQNCSFVADPSYYPHRNRLKSYLGRPWKEFSRTIIMESFIDDLIDPEGWAVWNGSFALNTLFYTEFNNRGPGSDKTKRAQWAGVKELPATRVQRYTASRFIEAETWIPATGVPFDAGFIFALPKENSSVKYSPVAPEEIKDLGQPKDISTDLIDKNINMPQAGALPPATAETTAASPPLKSGFPPSPAPYINAASPPLEGGGPPSPTPYISAASPPIVGGLSPSPAPYINTATTPPESGVSPSPEPYTNVVLPSPEGGSPPAPTPYTNTASPPLGSGVSPSPAPHTNAVSPSLELQSPPSPTPYINTISPPLESVASPPPNPYINTASPPLQGGGPPSPTPYANTASPPLQGGGPPSPTPYANTAAPPPQGGNPPSPMPSINAATPPVEGGLSPPPTSYMDAASPPLGSTTPPPTPSINAASPPIESESSPPPQPQAAENVAPSPGLLTESSQTTPPAAQSPQPSLNSPPSPTSSGAYAAADVNSPTSLPEISPVPSSQ